MKVKKDYVLIAVAIVLLGSINLGAVEYGDNTVIIENSSATELENKLQEAVPEKSAIRTDSYESSSSVLAENFLKKRGIRKGWNSRNQSIIVVQTAMRDLTDDPSYNSTFMNTRNMAAIEAVLRSKAAIIKAIRSNMSAADILIGPGGNLDEELSRDLKNIEKKLKGQKKALIRLLKEENIAYTDVQNGVTFKDRYNAFFDAMIKKLDDKYSTKKIEEKKLRKLDRIKTKLTEANTAYDKTSQQLAKLTGTVKQTQTSTREIFSKMPLFGATVVEQFESFDEDTQRYENTVIMLWSPKSEKASRAMLVGKDLIVPPGKESFNDYLNNNDKAWLTTTGGRRFRDDNGEIYFIGVAAEEIGGSASSDRRAMSMAKIEAQTQVAFALFADVKSQELMTKKEVVRNGGSGKDYTQSIKTMSEELSQSVKDISLQGASEVYSTTGIHPLTNNKVFVSIFAISSKGAKAAIKAEASSYMSKVILVDSQKKSKARKDSLVAKVTQREKETAVYNKERSLKSQTVHKRDTQKSQVKKSTSSKKGGSYSGVSSDNNMEW